MNQVNTIIRIYYGIIRHCFFDYKNKLFYISLFCLMYIFPSLTAQETIVVGQVLNKFDKTPISSVSVYFKGSRIYTLTNDEGYFKIRNIGEESVLVFSIIGYKREEIKVKPGESVGIEIQLEEKENLLNEIFVTPGVNPADDLMKKVRENRRKNNIRVNLTSKEQSVVFLSKNDTRWENNKLYEQFKSGNLNKNDSALLVPLYMEESTFNQTNQNKEQINKNTFNTSESAQRAVSTLLNGMDTEINFYENTISILGKSLISPLASISKTYYRYYLVDSIKTDDGKQYKIHFRSKNTKNLAFNGEMLIDSATYAITSIHADLPRQANLNFIHHLQIQQTFNKKINLWIPADEKSAWDITYEILKDSTHHFLPDLMIRKSAVFVPENGILTVDTTQFANSGYSEKLLENKMTEMQQSSLFKAASWFADAAITGYMRVGIFDIGKITDIMRMTETEGFRLGLPIRTNEKLWKNFMLGGYLAYGFKDKQYKYGLETQWKLPIEKKRIIVGAKYMNDYRRVDYDYNDYLWRENPLANGDEDFFTTIMSFSVKNRISKREEISAFVKNDWSDDIESNWTYRQVKYYANDILPLTKNNVNYSELIDQNISLTTRFSFGERVINKHFQRIYLKSKKPIIFSTIEGGKYNLGDKNGNYLKLTGRLLQNGQFALGEWRYMATVGKIFGNVPYPLLEFTYGKNTGGYNNHFEFAMMNYREYAADTYTTLFSEVITNGIIFNYVPFIRKLNLREMVSFKMAYGKLNDGHAKILDLPIGTSTFTQPYSEFSIGICNLLGILSINSIWRLSDVKKPDVKRWGIRLNLMFSF